jgi:UDP-glucose 4-epimerase
MFLVTGGLGFIGSHVVQALLDAGEDCVCVQRNQTEVPAGRFSAPVEVVRADATDLDALLAVGRGRSIDGIVHLAGSMPWPADPERPVAQARTTLGSLFNIAEAAQAWGVRRVSVASTIGVYAGAIDPLQGPLTEEMPLSVKAGVMIPTFKKVGELLNGHLAGVTGVEFVNLRISGTWGPLGHADPFFPAPELIHAAVAGRVPDLSGVRGRLHAEDSLDLCYVKDTARAVALIVLAETLAHRTYNVASGRATTNAEIAAAIRKAAPEAEVELPSGGGWPKAWLDIDRLRSEFGYEPVWDTARAAADYIAWLRAGNER